MLAKLVEQEPSGDSRHEVAITKEEFLIGRGTDCDLRLRGDAVSRHHCLIRIRPDEITLADLGSSNGTFINGQRIRSQAAIDNGDIIGVGEFRFTLEREGDSGIDWGPQKGAADDMPTCRMSGHEKLPPKKD